MKKPTIGCIGQGWVGKHIADNFESRGFSVVRYSKESPHNGNAEKITDCDIVFIAVPTPTTAKGFDSSIVAGVLKLVGKGKAAVIKSTMLPGTTDQLQKKNPDKFVFHAPEFLREAQAAKDVAHPNRNIIGVPDQPKSRKSEALKNAKLVISVLPKSPYELICSAKEAELIKYTSNCFLTLKVIYGNLIYDLAGSLGLDYEKVIDAVGADARIGKSHFIVDKKKRGAGGNCFIKDFAAFRKFFEEIVKDHKGAEFLRSAEQKNIHLLKSTGKDLELLAGVYGEEEKN